MSAAIDYAQQKPTLKWQLPFVGPWPMALAFVDGGKQLVAANQAGKIFLWNLAEPPSNIISPSGNRTVPGFAPVRELVGHTHGVTRLVAAPDGMTLYSASLDRTVRVWDLAGPTSGQTQATFEPQLLESESKRAKPSEVQQATVDVLPAATILAGHRAWVTSLAISADSTRLISGDDQGQVIVWNVTERAPVARWTGLAWNAIVSTSLAPDARTALVSEYRYKRDDFDIPAPAVRTWNVDTAAEQLDLLKIQFPKLDAKATGYDSSQLWRKFIAQGLVASDISPDGKLIALGQGGETEMGKIHVHDATDGKLLRTISGHQSGITDLRFTSDGRQVVSVGRDTCVRITAVDSGKEVAQLGTPRGGQFKDWLSALAISPDGRLLAATDIAGLIHVWSV